jgi:DNA-binding HxlR family transcriptional regulator
VPAFQLDGITFQSPVELALHAIGGKWKMPILWRLNQRVWRYSELQRDLARVSHKMLTQQLRELEDAGLLTRTVHPVVPPHVDYTITDLGRTALPAIEALRSWGASYRRAREETEGGKRAHDPDPARVDPYKA